MSNVFNTVFYKKPKRNVFNLSHDKKLSLDFGTLTPIFCQEVLPSDKFVMNTETLVRLAPMVAPVMHRMNVFTHFFFVPNRIVWDNWEEFITGGEDGQSQPEFPFVTLTSGAPGMLSDYLGCNSSAGQPGGKVNAIPFAAFNKIYNEYYRDQNLQSELVDELIDGDNTSVSGFNNMNKKPPFRAWRHDYFTSALPFAQKGAAVTIPIGQSANLIFDQDWSDPESATKVNIQESELGNYTAAGDPPGLGHYGERIPYMGRMVTALNNEGDASRAALDITSHTFVDLTSATSNTINDLRRAFRLQEWLEKNARGGTRYIELLEVHFGVKSQDSRLQRPEYLGGGKSSISVSEVLQTSSPQGDNDTPQGNLAGHGIGLSSTRQFSRYFQEHGFVIGIMSVMPEPAYQQGLDRQWMKFDKFDYFWQDFAHIGEQEITNRELFNNPFDLENDDVFGYTPRYSEYRFIPSTVHGDFKDTLDFWHFGRKFATRPHLNSAFIQCNPGKRIFAVQDLPDSGDGSEPIREWHTIYAHVFHKLKAIRPVPKFGIPSF